MKGTAGSNAAAPAARAASSDITRMGRGGGLNLLGAICNQLALFAIITLLARLGEEDVAATGPALPCSPSWGCCRWPGSARP